MGGDAKLRGSHVGRIWGRRDMHRWLRLKKAAARCVYVCSALFTAASRYASLCMFSGRAHCSIRSRQKQEVLVTSNARNNNIHSS